jgi:hypothetical protein
MQFAELLTRALGHLNLPARSVIGTCIYHVDGHELEQTIELAKSGRREAALDVVHSDRGKEIRVFRQSSG